MGKFKDFGDYIYSLSLSELVKALNFNSQIVNTIDNYIREDEHLMSNEDVPMPFYNYKRAKEQKHVGQYMQDLDSVNEVTRDYLIPIC